MFSFAFLLFSAAGTSGAARAASAFFPGPQEDIEKPPGDEAEKQPVRRELGSKWKTLVVVIGQCVIAWLAALVVYQTALVLL